MSHKLRHALTARGTDFLSDDLPEADEAFYGGRKQEGNHGRAQTVGMIARVGEKRPVSGTSADACINQLGYIAGEARIAAGPDAAADQLGSFIRSNAKADTQDLAMARECGCLLSHGKAYERQHRETIAAAWRAMQAAQDEE